MVPLQGSYSGMQFYSECILDLRKSRPQLTVADGELVGLGFCYAERWFSHRPCNRT